MTEYTSSDSFKETYYIKNDDGEFIPVSHYDNELMSSLPYGSHLIRVHPGRQTTRFHVDPDFAAVIAAIEYARDAIIDEIVIASQARPASKLLTKMQVEAWDNMKEAFGDDFYQINYPSAHEITNTALSELQFVVDEILSNENVKRAYDEFVLLAKLCGQEKQKETVK